MFTVNHALAATDLPGFRQVFHPGRLTLGLLFPIEAFSGDTPGMRDQERLAVTAEEQGFAALWVRDVPLRVPSFGDTGQVYDPWVYLAWIAAHTRRIALGSAAIVLPVRHPLHTAKAAASIDRLSGGRFLLGIASGDRPEEFGAFGLQFGSHREDFAERLGLLRAALGEQFPVIDSHFGTMAGVDLVPKPSAREIPVLVTGRSGQTLQWIAANAHGWLTYPRPLARQLDVAREWHATVRSVTSEGFRPFGQSLYIDLADDPAAPATPIHLGWRLGRLALLETLEALEGGGVNHVILNLKYGRRPAGEVMAELAESVLPRFAAPLAVVS